MEKYILLTRPKGQNTFLQKGLKKNKKLTYEFPSIKIVDSVLSQEQEDSILSLETFDWIIFTSVNGVNAFIHKMNLLGVDVGSISGIRIGAIGPSTKKAIENIGLVVSFMPSSFTSSKISEEIGDVSGLKILLPAADIAEDLSYKLKENGANVVNIPIYKTEYVKEEDPNIYEYIRKDAILAVTFTSASTVIGLVGRVKDKEALDFIKHKKVVCIGPVTADKARSYGFQNIFTADTYTLKGILNKLSEITHE